MVFRELFQEKKVFFYGTIILHSNVLAGFFTSTPYLQPDSEGILNGWHFAKYINILIYGCIVYGFFFVKSIRYLCHVFNDYEVKSFK